MLIIIDPTNKNKYRQELDDLHRLRKRIFHDTLGWDVPVVDDREIDPYDDMDPVYIVSVDEQTRAVRGGLRLMPTTGPHLMKDVFSAWFQNPVILESAAIWEATRFCVDPAYLHGPYTSRGLNLVTAELITGMCDLASKIGIRQLSAIGHLGMVNALKRAKCPYEIIGETQVPSGGRVYLGLLDVSPKIAAALRVSTGLAFDDEAMFDERRAA